MIYISKIPEHSNMYLDKAWEIKKRINDKSGLLKQKWSSFNNIYTYSTVYVAKDDKGDVIGYSCIDDDKYLALLAIEPEHQRTGIGSKLMNKIHKNYNYIYCHARVSNNNAYQFYIKHDFVNVKIEKSYYKNGENAYVLEYDNKNKDHL